MKKLQLNESEIEEYKEFHGSLISEMPKLIAEGRIPISVSDLMKRRLEVLTASDEVRTAWWDEKFYTGDAYIHEYPYDCSDHGKAKIILDSKHVRDINPKSNLYDGALVLDLSIDEYEKFEGLELKGYDLGRHGPWRPLEEGKEELINDPVWQTLARDKGLLKEYIDALFHEARNKPTIPGGPSFGPYLKPIEGRLIMRPFWVDTFYRWSAICATGFGGYGRYGYLVGRAAQARTHSTQET